MVIAIIPAKGGSTRLENKNMQKVAGKPMLQYAIDYAKESKRISKIYLSTDDENITKYGILNDILVIHRSSNLGGETPLIDVYRHALKTIKLSNISTVVGVQSDHPDRNISLDEALEYFQKKQLDYLLSTEPDGTKNGAHCIMSAEGIVTGVFERQGYIIDDCTNVHYMTDIKIAEKRIQNKK